MSYLPGLTFILSTASLFPLPLATTFRLAQEAGFDGLELVVTPEVVRREATYIAELSRRFGLPLLSLHGPLLPWPTRGRPQERHARSLALARDLGIPMVVFHPPLVVANSTRNQIQEDPLAAYGLESPQDGPCVSWENLPPRLTLATTALRLLRQGRFPITFDLCHAGVGGGDALGLYQELRERVVHVHLSDARDRTIPRLFRLWPLLHAYLRTHLVEHQRPGQGVLPIIPFLRRLREDSYVGAVALEISPFDLGVWHPRGALGRLRQALDFCRRA